MSNQIGMPKGCISCENFDPIGKKHDPNFLSEDEKRWGLGEVPSSWPYGLCYKTNARVWGTDICNKFKAEDLIDVVDVTEPRQAPFETRQDVLL